MSFSNARVVVASGADPAKYREEKALRGDPRFVISSSPLREFMHSPSRWIHGYECKGSDSTDWGTLLDTTFLTPDQFPERIAVQPHSYTNEKGEVKDWSNNAKKCKEWNAYQEAQGKLIVSGEEVAECDKAIKRLIADATIAAWHVESDKQVWLAGDWTDAATGIVVPCKALLDYVPHVDSEYSKCLGDLKTTRSAFPKIWPRYVKQRGYHIQAAFNTDLYIAATGEDRVTWCWILSENYPPYEVGKEMMDEKFMEMGRREYRHALHRYAHCLKTGKWPAYDDLNTDSVQGWSLCRPEPWMEFEDLSRAMELDQSEAAEEDTDQQEDIVP